MSFLNRNKERRSMIYRVKEPFSYTDSRGVPRVMRVGDLVTADHDAYREKWSHLYEPVTEAAERDAHPGGETADASPSGRRTVSTASKSDDLDALRQKASDLGVEVDGRWSAKRLQQEIDKAKAAE